MAEIRENIRRKIRKLDWLYDNHMVTDAEYGTRLEYLLNMLEGVRKNG